jgi:hypothetical protein
VKGERRSQPWSAASLPPSPSLRRDECEADGEQGPSGWLVFDLPALLTVCNSRIFRSGAEQIHEVGPRHRVQIAVRFVSPTGLGHHRPRTRRAVGLAKAQARQRSTGSGRLSPFTNHQSPITSHPQLLLLCVLAPRPHRYAKRCGLGLCVRVVSYGICAVSG